MTKDLSPQSNELIFYSSPDGDVKVEVFFQEETFWLSQKKMAELFGVDVRTVNEHLQNIYKTKELEKAPTIRNIRIVQKEGSRDVSRDVDFYNLDAIIAVGYRYVSGLRRKSSRKTDTNENDRMDYKARCLPAIQRVSNFKRRWKSKARSRETTG